MSLRNRALRNRATRYGSTLAIMLLATIVAAHAEPRPAEPAAPLQPAAVAPPAATVPPLPACAGRTDVLGVSRVVEIDTKTGPRFGLMQYPDLDFLEDGEVVLTFDDGPLRRYTEPVLKALDEHCTRATFFIVGRMAVADPDMAREMARRGHTVGTHTWSHRNLRATAPIQAKGEIELGVSVAAKVLPAGQAAPFFRFPYLSDPKGMIEHARTRDIGMFSIDVDSRDFRTRNPNDVVRTVMSQVMAKRKGIILFHDIQPSTAGGLRTLLGELKAKGFKVVHLVPKSAVTTLPEYDAMAERELSRKMLTAARDPLATRSMVWPVSKGQDEPAAGATAGAVKPTAARAAKPPAAPENLPWAKPSVVAAPPPVAAAPPPVAAAPPKRRFDDDNWSSRIFQNY